jgi:hypothetical protein
MRARLYQVDAFTTRDFSGNPAAVVALIPLLGRGSQTQHGRLAPQSPAHRCSHTANVEEARNSTWSLQSLIRTTPAMPVPDTRRQAVSPRSWHYRSVSGNRSRRTTRHLQLDPVPPFHRRTVNEL